jgi:hypothetical protein
MGRLTDWLGVRQGGLEPSGSHPLNNNQFHEITRNAKVSGFPWRDHCRARRGWSMQPRHLAQGIEADALGHEAVAAGATTPRSSSMPSSSRLTHSSAILPSRRRKMADSIGFRGNTLRFSQCSCYFNTLPPWCLMSAKALITASATFGHSE